MNGQISTRPRNRNQKYSLEDYLAYRDLLAKCSNNESNEVIFNDSYVHAAMVLTYIFRYMLKQNIKDVSMYCGKFALLRDSAKSVITELRTKVKPTENDMSRMNQWQEFNPYEDLLTTFEDFMSDGGQMNVIVESDVSSIISESIWECLEKHIFSGKLIIKRLIIPLRLNHFIVAGKSYRQENDDVDKTAICCFNDDATCKLLKKNYQILELMSETCKF